ncbi:hypothetical protein CANARDRAFT_211670 [[Candida] arabinofermentans NRRL YB-2248]|uniref:Nucleolar complex-associated protein 3 n=1 Tax=[Candida] arabinofermentans NRRL YB-2248 TaxID=983967 RepID=A0A1E4T3E8_9ASCO|nr:hypothetical protein CANARDRAFT_211670 [[Candida] arabinofermentans NRRL YB-2248]
MGKRKIKRSVELRHNKRQKDEDSKLADGLFNKYGKDEEDDQMDQYEPEVEENEDHDDVFDNDEEQDYELKPRSFQHGEAQDLVEGLPIRKDGMIQRVVREIERKPVAEPEPSSGSESEEEEKKEETKDADGFDDELDETYKDLTPTQRLIKTKEDIATLAEGLIEDPEENIIMIVRLRKMASSRNPNTAKLALLALVPVFKSISPAYRIRALTETEKREKVSKEIQKLRFFEENLIINYRHYVNLLSAKSKVFFNSSKVTELDIQLGLLATNAACELATSLRFFNYRSDLFQILVRRIMRTPANDTEYELFEKCVKCLEELLTEDYNHGDISLEVIRLLSKSLKNREFKVDESTINILLSLEILNDYDPNARAEEKEQNRLRKKDRVHLSKKEKKQRKEKKLIDEEMRKAELAITAEERERNQAQILKALLTLYLEVLRAKPEKLMAPVLEGLAKFGHQVNIDLMGDFLQVLREVSEDLLDISKNETNLSNNHLRQILLCIVTSFSLIANLPTKKVSMDLNRFVEYLYSILPILSQDVELEFSHKSLRLIDPFASKATIFKPNVNISTKSELLLRSMDSIFFNSKSGSKKRALGFTKRLYLNLLQFPEKTSIATLKFLEKLLGRYEEVKGLYTTEDRIQNGIYHAEIDEVERANPDVAVLWENVLLEKHYCPTVAMGAKSLMNKAK